MQTQPARSRVLCCMMLFVSHPKRVKHHHYYYTVSYSFHTDIAKWKLSGLIRLMTLLVVGLCNFTVLSHLAYYGNHPSATQIRSIAKCDRWWIDALPAYVSSVSKMVNPILLGRQILNAKWIFTISVIRDPNTFLYPWLQELYHNKAHQTVYALLELYVT